ncbi:MAG TPA: trehalose-6-phosphate synthase, partial [Candidatus Saccharimonadales bacterium]|nr:trehalose-6-phosphate synthase [Candidatus Saccharimonadales bacterium]
MNETQPVSHKNVMVSYRGPLTVNQTPQGYESAKSDGGLVTVLTPIAENIPNSVWIGSPGIPEQGHIREFAEKAALEKSYGLGYFWLSQDEEKGAKHVYSDQVLWQAAHGEPQNIVYEPCAFNYYLEANRKAAEAALKELGPSDPVWFHDIQLMTAPRMMRTMGSNHDIGSYVHAQFPLPEHWGVVPERRELLYGHLASNLIGFQTVDDMENFTTNTQAYFKNSRLENTPQGLTINNQGEKTSVFVDPVGIDLDEFRNVANQPQTQERARQIEQELNGKHEILVVGRTDVTKAIPAAIRALETVLEKHPELIDKVHMTILAIPSR